MKILSVNAPKNVQVEKLQKLASARCCGKLKHCGGSPRHCGNPKRSTGV